MAPRSACLYLRASTEHQNYSTTHQRAALEAYAHSRGLVVVREYVDEAKSGLTLSQRPGLSALLKEVETGEARFAFLLVYDVSRWGRFQDVDESAYYEFACRRMGVNVAYCAEPFINDGSPFSAVLKGLKRAMAAEYSRELSDKVFHAQCRHTRSGFKQGGSSGYGLRRQAVSADGEQTRVLQYGERKPRPTDRVVFVAGPDDEIRAVQQIYRWYVDDHHMDTTIATLLNEGGIVTELGGKWTSYKVKSVLTNEKYTGTLIFNRRRSKLRSPSRLNADDEWVRTRGAFRPIVSIELFEQARAERRRRRTPLSDEELLAGLRAAKEQYGSLNSKELLRAGLPSHHYFTQRFGGLVKAYQLAGIAPPERIRAAVTRENVRNHRSALIKQVVECSIRAGVIPEPIGKDLFRLTPEVSVSVQVCRSRHEAATMNWRINAAQAEFVIAALLDRNNTTVVAYVLNPVRQITGRSVWPTLSTLDQFTRFDALEDMFGLSGHSWAAHDQKIPEFFGDDG